MNVCYILFSPSLKKFYTGVSHEGVLLRLAKHNSNFYGKEHFTAQANDWEVFLVIECRDFSQAVRIERNIKRMKSSVYIQNLK